MAFENIEEEERMLKNELGKYDDEQQDAPINVFNMHNDGYYGHDDNNDMMSQNNMIMNEHTVKYLKLILAAN